MDNNNFITINIYYHKVNDYIEYFSIIENNNNDKYTILKIIEDNNKKLYKLIKESLDYAIKEIITNDIKYNIKLKINIPENIKINNIHNIISNIHNNIMYNYAKTNKHYPELSIEIEDKMNIQKNCKAL